MVWRADGPQGNESAKVRWDIVPYTRGRVLDLGCGQWKTFPHFVGVDNGHHWGKADADILVSTCERLELFASQSCDAVFSSHLLEHIHPDRVAAALREWWRVVKPDGYLVLYVPHEDLYPKVGEDGANPDHKWNVNPEKIIGYMKEIGGWDLLVDETRDQDDEYSILQVYQKRPGRAQAYSCRTPKPAKTAAVVRYGAFGDAIQASSILPALKEQGYHVTMYVTPTCHDVLLEDPHIDRFVIQDREQVPNMFLGEFWAHERKKFDKWVNLSESVEGTFLPDASRTSHGWPHALRHSMMNRNYLEFAHAVADVPFKPAAMFYPTADERKWAAKERARMAQRVVLWSLAGSSVHKLWPHLDAVIARLMIEAPDTDVVLVGDEACQILETGWENERRVHRRSGKWTIRQSMTFCFVADLIVGTETGLLNAAGLIDTPKVITLSHSSVENLTKHWKSTTSLIPWAVDCYPCHRLHHNFEFCREHKETGTAMCQHDIGAERMYEAIAEAMKWQRAAA